MDPRMQMLAAARDADVERAARERRLNAEVETCRTWLLGVIPVSRSCQSSSS